jgi:dihydrofolate reductase
MSKLTITTFVTLDGVMQAPGGPAEDPSGSFTHGGWVFPYSDGDMGKFMADVFSRADAFLLGRGTYQIFSNYWPKVTDPKNPIAVPLNKLPKHVASKTLSTVTWAPSMLIRDVVSEVPGLKQQYQRELQVHGSAGLIQTLIQHGLVDELNLLTYPVILGTGKRLFGSGTVPTAFKLVSTRMTGTGVIISVYQHAGRPKYGSF